MIDLTNPSPDWATIRKYELAYFIHYVAEVHTQNISRIHKLTLAEQIAHALMKITSLYALAIGKERRGWTCGTHSSRVREITAQIIAKKYPEEVLFDFIAFCETTDSDWTNLLNLDNALKTILVEFLAIRPKPMVHSIDLPYTKYS